MKKQIKKAYQEILEVCEKHANLDGYEFNDIRDMCSKAKNHLLIVEWSEKYGIELSQDSQLYTRNHLRIGEYMFFNYYNDAKKEKAQGQGRYISWSDDGRQPKNEWLFCISFSTGAYIFGKDYEGQKQIFQDFFNELNKYKPDYLDSHNHCLYWKLKNAKKIYNDFNDILKKYHEINKADLKRRKIKALKKELKSLEDYHLNIESECGE